MHILATEFLHYIEHRISDVLLRFSLPIGRYNLVNYGMLLLDFLEDLS